MNILLSITLSIGSFDLEFCIIDFGDIIIAIGYAFFNKVVYEFYILTMKLANQDFRMVINTPLLFDYINLEKIISLKIV